MNIPARMYLDQQNRVWMEFSDTAQQPPVRRRIGLAGDMAFLQFFLRDVEIPLRLLDVGVAEHQLNRAEIHSVCQEPAGAFVTEVVPCGRHSVNQARETGRYWFLSSTAGLRYGGFYEGTRRELSWRSRMEFSPQLYVEPTISWNRIELPWRAGTRTSRSAASPIR